MFSLILIVFCFMSLNMLVFVMLPSTPTLQPKRIPKSFQPVAWLQQRVAAPGPPIDLRTVEADRVQALRERAEPAAELLQAGTLELRE